MKCQTHHERNLTNKCKNCEKYLCQMCLSMHTNKKHTIITITEIAEQIRDYIQQQIIKLQKQIELVQSTQNYDQGLNVIMQFNKTFEQLKMSYINVMKSQWKTKNSHYLEKIQDKMQMLDGWDKVIQKQPFKAIIFDIEQLRKEDIVSYHNIKQIDPTKIVFNELQLRRASESITSIIGLSRLTGKKIHSFHQEMMTKFIEGTNNMFEYSPGTKNIKKIIFRQFLVPMRSESVTIDNQIFLIGGLNKSKQPSKQIWIYERSYNIMRIVAMMKKGRVGHCLIRGEDCIYVFGGKDVFLLEKLNVKTKILEIMGEFKKSILGCSGCIIKNNLYFFGGGCEEEINKNIICYRIQQDKWLEIQPLNPLLYQASINPLVHQITSSQIILLGGYKRFKEYSYANLTLQLYNIETNYFSSIGNGQILGTITSNGYNINLVGGNIVSVCNMKRSSKAHGPNLPCLLHYSLKDDRLDVDLMMPL